MTAIADRINALSIPKAEEVYAGLRAMVNEAQAAGRRPADDVRTAMVAAGDALEARIGADRFDALMDRCDA